MEKMKVGLLFGGISTEHEVSLNSANAIANNFDKEKFEIIPIAIGKNGCWFGPIPIDDIATFKPENYQERKVTILPQPNNGLLLNLKDLQPLTKLDVIFPILHGTFGEDGTIQGLLELANIPYVGSGVLGSALGIDKDVMKKIFTRYNFPQVKYLPFSRTEIEKNMQEIIEKIINNLNFPLFIKPANLGSSVGITKANNQEELKESLLYAIKFDRKIVVEEGVEAREIEISVLGNEQPIASLPGEIIPANEFYDYKAKYLDNNSLLKIPAQLDENLIKQIQKLAVDTFLALDLSGLARVDFFLCKKTGEIFINEVNTLPGFTEISMYPKLWNISGLPMDKLLEKLVDLAIERFKDKCKNTFNFNI